MMSEITIAEVGAPPMLTYGPVLVVLAGFEECLETKAVATAVVSGTEC